MGVRGNRSERQVMDEIKIIHQQHSDRRGASWTEHFQIKNRESKLRLVQFSGTINRILTFLLFLVLEIQMCLMWSFSLKTEKENELTVGFKTAASQGSTPAETLRTVASERVAVEFTWLSVTSLNR